MSDLTGVRYVFAGARVLTADDLAGVGVDAKGDLVWDAANDFTVPISELNAATVDYLSQLDEFELV